MDSTEKKMFLFSVMLKLCVAQRKLLAADSRLTIFFPRTQGLTCDICNYQLQKPMAFWKFI